jgi:hypothetical protein
MLLQEYIIFKNMKKIRTKIEPINFIFNDDIVIIFSKKRIYDDTLKFILYIYSILLIYKMIQNENIDLKKLVTSSDYIDNTNKIRKLKHSQKIKNDLRRMDSIKKDYGDSSLEKCKIECCFLYNNYTDIFNKYFNDEIDIQILAKLLIILKLIEENKIEQEAGSVMVGKILKEMYIDCALKYSDKKEEKIEEKKEIIREQKNIKWSNWKKT